MLKQYLENKGEGLLYMHVFLVTNLFIGSFKIQAWGINISTILNLAF
jgi:hypothetical protein